MGKRILSCVASDFRKFSAEELKLAIQAGEGRTVCCEMAIHHRPIIPELTHAEIASAFGGDLMLLNGFDCLNPKLYGVEGSSNPIERLKELCGRPIGANLESVDLEAEMLETRLVIPAGRICSKETLKSAEALGLDFICLTGNPGTGVTNQAIAQAIQKAKKYFTGVIIAGKMHGAGSKEPVMNRAIAKELIEAGADILLVPAVGTVPGFTEEALIDIVQFAHEHETLVLSAIGTSQEGSSKEVIEQIAIRNKICGVDIQHIGDAGYGGLADVNNIFALSVAIRGMRHTVARMASSVVR